ncbi:MULTISPECIES: copper homeostasis membrane protein CopD [Providencia]|uniref:copper homeostasis membrane protein CopD n=1 Tax=Providencia TaxID=586 RepID=UPI0018E80F85|nr:MULTISPECIES: copper homeostasis membrane protein CopD [Providencia]EJD6506074.1 copper homeostasis membrane protein CopD [Providencia rettgeri]ELR5198852.1 copper homeostasis membrane protein CopD [Providencia rettgeri]MBQ0317443.1 copper homeostasis membrane protein CopD [Providencia rettgeri]MBQ0325434.1 copper homeostasis membrane protein CopD [Providencia rettgeri]MBQ0349235.1 copper homeostasis membrane protein CopD [Providencia rettgeri]
MSLEAFYTLIRFIHFIAAILMCGMSIFAVLLSRGKFRYLLVRYLNKGIFFCAIITSLTTFGWLLAQAGLMGDGWEDSIDWAIWQGVLGTSFGQIWRWQLLFAVILLLVLCIKSIKLRLNLVLLLSIALLGLHAFIGHAAMTGGVIGAFHRINQFIHLISAAYWFGGLWPFLICIQFLRHKQELVQGMDKQIISTMRLFSKIGHVAVVLVILTGVISAITILPEWPLAFSGSEYQSLLWFKIILVLGMVMLALINRYYIVPGLKHRGRLNYLIINSWVELLLGTMAILAVAIFATYQPI